MQLIGVRHTYPDGQKVVLNATASGTTASIALALDHAQSRRAEEQARADAFIPSYLFVGPEMPLPRAMRQLVTDRRDIQ